MIPKTTVALGGAIAIILSSPPSLSIAKQTAGGPAAQEQQTAPEPLSDDELEVLAARIALHPDELVAIISAAAWPVTYAETGMKTFVVNQQGSDLGPSTEAIVPFIDRFDPDDKWDVGPE
ncbi:DUF2950 family protein [Ensifer sp. ENS02]|nr:DUF2950 family protein [Ensifer sp. ENS02]